ncbi:hypothetical protein PC129_g21553 [Phytophthora cactorum]|uniref:Uncharacterized protein n=1 Tax=Phytophthora cactorum TaxID=29920 RepID=A0A329RDN7_9STRA|nr:hypothetical protein Pcac1_g14224 [Phytophthora cactorum]KAG2796244.1 hypothetical protein PC111_g21808 [Phytophthora cactorum]KAG2796567.1 hypothetical protein PC112_g22151 [Phytophthora cactorum]KAG2823593.1 hypothetical protein PC113_g22164 [Phytophthora cactorum]KAG2875293.1 hypothetical protein PC114_g24811 [Phytophthora cactorum]
MLGQGAILGTDFMVPAGIQLDLADRVLCLPDEVRIQLMGRRPLYGEHVPAQSLEVPLHSKTLETLWLTRRERWIVTVVKGRGKRSYLRITNVSEQTMCIPAHAQLGMWLTGYRVCGRQDLATVGSRRYAEW